MQKGIKSDHIMDGKIDVKETVKDNPNSIKEDLNFLCKRKATNLESGAIGKRKAR